MSETEDVAKSRHKWGPDDVCKTCGVYRSGCSTGRTGSMNYYEGKGGTLLGQRAPVCDPGFRTRCQYGRSPDAAEARLMATCCPRCSKPGSMMFHNGGGVCPLEPVCGERPGSYPSAVWLAVSGAGNWMACPSEEEAAKLVARWDDRYAHIEKYVRG